MICALMIGRDGSSGFPGKNLHPVLGRPLAAYPLMAAQAAPSVDAIYLSTDSPGLTEIALGYGAEIIDRPAYLCTNEALGEDALHHSYEVIRDQLAARGEELEILVLLMANAATLTTAQIEEAISVLRTRPDVDSAVTVSRYNMWSPLRARQVGDDGLLHPFVAFEVFGDPKTLNCDRDSQGDVLFADMGFSVVRPRCFDHMDDNLLPQKWMGNKIHPIHNWGGLDVDYEWQLPQVEFWLKAHGIVAAD